MQPMLRGLVVTGTDTEVGKTHITAMILRALQRAGWRVGAYKPVCTGAILSPQGDGWIWDDLERLRWALAGVPEQRQGEQAAGLPFTLDDLCPQRFHQALAPPVAARYEGRTIDEPLLIEGLAVWQGRVEVVVVEGVGGWLCPVSESATFADLAEAWGAPVLIVARRGLGTINHTLLTVESIRRRGLPIAGVILNEATPPGDDRSVLDNAEEISRRSGVPVLGELLHGEHDQLRWHGQPITINWSERLGRFTLPASSIQRGAPFTRGQA